MKDAEQTTPEKPQFLPDWRAVLAYAAGKNRKLGKTKMFEDIRKGLLQKQVDGSFLPWHVDRYLASLPFKGTPDSTAIRAHDRLKRREEAEIRKAEAMAAREEFDLAVKKGKYVLRQQVHLELAGRAVLFQQGLKTALESALVDLIALAEGNP